MHGLVPLPRRADKPLSTTPSVPSRPSRPHAALPPLFTDTLLREACLWLYRQRQHYPADADIWHLRFHREALFPQILKSLNTGTWQFSPLSLVRKANGDTVAIWSAADALVLKCLTLLLSPVLPVHPQCEHVKGHGGGRQSVKRVHQSICNRGWKYVCRTDIKGYYGNISKNLLYSQLLKHVTDPRLTLLLWQFLHYSVEEGGTFHTPAKGISRSSPLSPLLAAFHLTEMDACFAKMPGIRYARYMDDFIILTRTRRQLRRGVRQLNTWFSGYGFRQHPDKTFIGPLKKGFDWMGFWFTDQGCRSPPAPDRTTATRCAGFMSKSASSLQMCRPHGWTRMSHCGTVGCNSLLGFVLRSSLRLRMLRHTGMPPGSVLRDVPGAGGVRVTLRSNSFRDPLVYKSCTGTRHQWLFRTPLVRPTR